MSETLIDHIFGTKCLDVSNVTQALGISDHNMQVVDFDIPMLPPSSCQRWIRSFKKCDWNQLREVLRAIPWQMLDTFDKIDDTVSGIFFTLYCLECLTLFCLFIKQVLEGLGVHLHG